MSQDHEPPKSSKDRDQRELSIALPSKTYKKYPFKDVYRDFKTWRKENTCQSCFITFENFHARLNHTCKPYRCGFCIEAFDQEFMLKKHQIEMHQSECNSDYSGRSSYEEPHICTACHAPFSERSALLKHQNICGKKKRCDLCEKPLPMKTRKDNCCSKCLILLKGREYSLRCNSSSKPEGVKTGVMENGNGLLHHPLTNDTEINGEEKINVPNHVVNYTGRNFGKTRKRRSLDIAQNSKLKKPFEATAIDSLSNSDTSLDQLDARCSLGKKKDMEENWSLSLAARLGNSSKKGSKKIPKVSIDSSFCNGAKDFKPRGVESYNSGLDEPLNFLSSSRQKRNLEEPRSDSLESRVRKALKKTDITKECGSVASSLEKVDQALTQRKSKRYLNNRKASVDHPLVEKKSETEKSSECPTISVESSGSAPAPTKNSFDSAAKNDTKESYESSSILNSHKDEITASKLSVGTFKERAAKKSSSLNPVTKLTSSRLCESPELKDPINTYESTESSVRKSKRRINRDESAKKSELSERDGLVKQNEKNCLTDKKDLSNLQPTPYLSGRISKHKKDSETSNDSSCQRNPVAVDSDAASSVSASSVKGQRISRRKKHDDSSLPGKETDRHKDKGKSSAKPPVPAPKPNRVSSKTSRSYVSSHEKNKLDKAQEVEKPAAETSVASKAAKFKLKSNEKAQKETVQSRKQPAKSTSTKTPENPSLTSRRGSFGSAKQNGNGVKSYSRNKISSVRTSHSSIDYTPELEVSESTLTSVPDVSFKPHGVTRGGGKVIESDKALAKIGRVSNAENDSIRLESLLNVLPDADCGVLLRVLSNTSDNYRCLKCNKLFKTIKMASTHYKACNSRVKRTTSLLLKDIIWICVQCNFHCYQMSELNFHRQSCSHSSNSVSIDNCIQNYTNTCRKYCSKCSFSCISVITFNKHACEQRLDQMTKCVIGIKRLSKEDVSIQKYECTYCESTFVNLKAYKRHIAKHTLSTEERPQSIKQEPEGTAEDVLKSLLEAKFSTLNRLVSHQESSQPVKAAGERLEKENSRENRTEIGKILNFLQKEGEGSPLLDLPDSEIQVPDEIWRTYQKDHGCRCKQHMNAVEEKPCLACLNAYIKSKEVISCQTDCATQTDPLLLEDAAEFPPTSRTDIPTPTTCNVPLSSSVQNFATSSLCPQELSSPIHIASVSSYSNPLSIFTGVDSGSITDIPNFPPSTLMQNEFIPALSTGLDEDKFPSQGSPRSSKSELYISLILILKGNFVDSKYSVEKHNNLVKSIYELKFSKLAEPHQVPPNKYYLLSEYIPSGNEQPLNLAYDPSVLQNYFLIERPFSQLMPLFACQEPCDFDVVLCDSFNHFIHLSWQSAPDISYSAYCAKSDSEPTGINLICGRCLEEISFHLLIEHFDKEHEGAYHYNILIQ